MPGGVLLSVARVTLSPWRYPMLTFAFSLLSADPITLDLPSLLIQFMSLAGYASLVAAVVNILKVAKVVKDGQAPTASLLLNVAGFVALVLVRVFSPQADIDSANQTIETVAHILVLGLGLITQFGASKLANNGLRGLPLIGYSHSLEKNKALLARAESAPPERTSSTQDHPND